MFQFCSFSSGSSGNCYLIQTENTAVLVDAGISVKRIREGLSRVETPEEKVQAVLVTHEHYDHVKSVAALMGSRGLKRTGDEPLKFYANEETWHAYHRLPLANGKCTSGEVCVKYQEDFCVGDIQVHTFHLSHDSAAAMGYALHHDGKSIVIVTDTGIVTDEIRMQTEKADLLVLESNHDVDMLRIGRYPWFLKQRIAGDYGHLSNDSAAQLVVSLLDDECSPKRIAMAHLSKENNFPEMAWQTMKNALEEAGYQIGKDIEVHTLVRDTISEVFTV